MTATRLWASLGGYWAVAAASVVAYPGSPVGELPPAPAAAAGALAGALLFAGVARARPRVPRRIAAGATLVLAALAEELVWRRLALGWLVARWPTPAALAGATVLFALAHRRARATQLVTGATFGTAYLLGGLAAAVCAHAAYNLAAAGAAWGRR